MKERIVGAFIAGIGAGCLLMYYGLKLVGVPLN